MKRAHSHRRRGAAAVVLVLVLVTLQLVVVGSITGAGPDGPTTESRVSAARALYAAEAGVNMAVRERMLAADLDADGSIGAISHDGNDANDPDLGHGARVCVTREALPGAVPQTRLSSRGRAGPARRVIQTILR